MKLDCVLTSCNLNELYLDFIPIFIKAWNKLYPETDVKIVLISSTLPDILQEYSKNIILFEPLKDISTTFISQYIRSLYPALLEYKNGVMITDIDILPMNSNYYINNIQNIDDNKFIYYRHVLLNIYEIAMCYNVATPLIWKEIFNINNLEDINKILLLRYSQIKYNDIHGGIGWSTDQKDLYTRVIDWNKKTNNFIHLNDSLTGFKRLDRNTFSLTYDKIDKIKNGYYSDYHMYRPYKKHKEINDKIVDLL